MKMFARIFAFLCGLYVTAALAAYQPGSIVQIPTVAALQAGNFTNTPYINIANYATPGDGGGGTFVPCKTGPCTVDSGVVFQDAAGNKFLRQFSGEVHLSWYGIPLATSSPCIANRASCAVDTQFAAAFVASAAYGNRGVDADGMSFVLNSGTPTVPYHSSLDCGIPPYSQQTQSSSGVNAYYTQAGFIVLGAGVSLWMDGFSEISNCSLLPSTYNTTYSTTAQLFQNVLWNYKGTALKLVHTGSLDTPPNLQGEGIRAHDLFIVGFDVCIESAGTQRVGIWNIRGDCNEVVWSHNQKGGFELHDINGKEYLLGNYDGGSGRISQAQADITNVQSGANGQMVITYDTSNGDPFYPDFTVLVSGMGDFATVSDTGSPNGDGCAINQVCDLSDDTFDNTGIEGSLISGTCIPPNTYVTNVDPPGNDVTMSKNATCSAMNEPITFSIDSPGPGGADGRWILQCGSSPCGGTATLIGSQYTGVTYSGSLGLTWYTGHSFMAAADTTNIQEGTFACASGTAPFCTPPSGWASTNQVGASGLTALGTSGVGNVVVGNTASWPSFGFVRDLTTGTSEYMRYTVVSPTQIRIASRGADGTTGQNHADGDTLKASAPQVVTKSPLAEKVLLNTEAASSQASPQTVQFLNDLTLTSYSVPIGGIGMTAGYKTWTSLLSSGGTPDSLLTVLAGGAGSSTITGVGNAWKIQPGMTVADLTTPGNISGGNVVCGVDMSTGANTPFSGTVTIGVSYDNPSGVCTGSATIGAIAADTLQFSGCGYPFISSTPKPWLGNCAATAFLMGNIFGNKSDTQGGHVYAINDHGHRRGIGAIHWLDGHVNDFGMANGGGAGAQLDMTSVGIQSSETDRTAFQIGVIQGSHTAFSHVSSVSKDDGDELINTLLATKGGVAFETGNGMATNLTVIGVHGQRPGSAFLSEQQLSANLTGNLLPNVQLVLGYSPTQDAATTTTGCGNTFSNTTAGTCIGQTPINGSLSIRGFGGIPDWATDSTAALTAAETAAAAQGIHTILLDGDSRGTGYVFGTHSVPNNIQLVCPGPITAPPTSNDYRNYPQSIILSTTAGLTFTGGSGMHGCNVLQRALANSTPPATFQDNYTRAQSFTGTAITVTGDNVVIDSGNIIGFNIGLLTKGSRQLTFHDLNIDAATVCYQIFNQGGGGTHQGYNLQCSPYATRFGTLAEPQFPLSSITDNGSGVAQAHLTSPCTGTNCILNGYKVWINSGSNANAQSVYGLATAANVTSSTIDLVGLSSAFFNGGQTETVTTTTGSTYVSGAATNFAQIQPTQAVAGTCVSGGTTVAQIVPPGLQNYSGFWLSAPATTTGSCTVTISDTSPATVVISGVAIGNSGGTGYQAGDQVSPSTGTGTQAVFDVNEVDGGASGGPGVVTRLGLNDGGSYTVAPSPLTNSPTTGGAGTGLTVNLSTGASLYGSATVRNGPAFSFSKLTDVRITNCGELSHTTGMQFGLNAHAVLVTNCSLHDENVLQAPNAGIAFTSNSNNNKLDHVDSYYFGPSVLCDSLAASNLGANVVSGSSIGGSAGNSGLQNTIFAIGSPTPGTNSKASCTLVGNATTVIGTVVVMGDERSVNLGDNSFNNSTIVTQNAAAQNLITGAGNTLANGSAPVYAVKAPNYITPGSLNESGGQKNLNNASTTFTPYVDGSKVFDTGALTNNRNLTLSNAGATAGFTVTVIRTGSTGGFTRSIFQADGTTLITAMADGTTATFAFNSVTNLWVKQ